MANAGGVDGSLSYMQAIVDMGTSVLLGTNTWYMYIHVCVQMCNIIVVLKKQCSL